MKSEKPKLSQEGLARIRKAAPAIYDRITRPPKELNPDESFEFVCQKCCRCCRTKNGIRVNIPDMKRIALHLEVTFKTLLDSYVELKPLTSEDGTFVDENIKTPQIRMVDGACPFLKERGCSVYDVRPSTCRAFPIRSGDEKRWSLPAKGDLDFECPGFEADVSWTVEEWFKANGLQSGVDY